MRRSRLLSALIPGLVASLTACSSSSSSQPTATSPPDRSASSTSVPTTDTKVSANGTTVVASSCSPVAPTKGGTPSGGDASPPGDIPDNLAFVPFTSASGRYTIRLPEGWARTDLAGDSVSFTDKLNTIRIDLVTANAAPTVQSATATELPAIRSTAGCFEAGKVAMVTRRAGPAVLITYRSDGAPDPVTGKVVHDDVERYELWKAGTEAVLTLSGPQGSDNVDAWKLVTDSFQWR